MKIDICLSPALYPYYAEEGDTVIIVDIFRATTTICTILYNGAKSVIPIASVEKALEYKTNGFLVGGERNAKKIDFADYGNSPFDYTPERVEEEDVVFTTTNGTQAINIASDSGTLLVGAFSNIDALAEQCVKIGNRIVVLCSGWKNKVNTEDTLFAGALAKNLHENYKINLESDSARMAVKLWESAKDNPLEFIITSDHYKRLIDNNAEADIDYCFIENSAPVVPIYNKVDKKLFIL